MSNATSGHAGELAWSRAFRAKLDQVAAVAGNLDWRHFGRAPSRLWLMEADEIERLPIADFIAAFGVPRGVVRRRTQLPQHSWDESGAGDGPRGTSGGQRPAVATAPERPQCRGPSPRSSPNTWWSYPVGVSVAAAAAIAVLMIG